MVSYSECQNGEVQKTLQKTKIVLPSKVPNQILIWENGVLKEHKDQIDGKFSGLALNFQGTLLAISSLTGKHVRFFKVENLEDINFIKMFDRGRHEVTTLSMQFNLKSEFLTMTTDSNTIHVFPVPRVLRQNVMSESVSESQQPIDQSLVGVGGFFHKYLM